jgi:hypothetical protein
MGAVNRYNSRLDPVVFAAYTRLQDALIDLLMAGNVCALAPLRTRRELDLCSSRTWDGPHPRKAQVQAAVADIVRANPNNLVVLLQCVDFWGCFAPPPDVQAIFDAMPHWITHTGAPIPLL